MTTNTGGPAFPVVHPPVKGITCGGVECYGLTIRDYFAARLMVQIMDETKDTLNFTYSDGAKHAYQAADAMLKARG